MMHFTLNSTTPEAPTVEPETPTQPAEPIIVPEKPMESPTEPEKGPTEVPECDPNEQHETCGDFSRLSMSMARVPFDFSS